MERDFLGLSSKEPPASPPSLAVHVKEEVNTDGYKDFGMMQWPFSNKVSTHPHLSFKVGLEDNKTKKFGSDALVSSGFMSTSTTDASDSFQKHSAAQIQKLLNLDRHGGNHFSLTAYPVKHDVRSMYHLHDVKMFPVSNHAISNSMVNPFFKNHPPATVQDMNTGTNTMKPQLLGGIPVTASHLTLPTVGSVAGVTETCVKASGSPAQLTIFYAGTVNVYDDITPEKAQAIMLLAGNGNSSSSNMAHPKIQVQAPSSKPAVVDASPVIQPVTTPPCSRISSPLSVSSHSGAQSGSGSTSTEEIMAAKTTGAVTAPVSKTTGAVTTPVSKPKPAETANTVVSVATTTMIPSAVPQARKASLARFLEKRKERVMNAAPYNLSKKSLDFAIAET